MENTPISEHCDPDCPVLTPNRASSPKWEKNGRKMDFGFPFFGHFFPQIHFSAIFSHFGLEARFGVCTGQSGSQDKHPISANRLANRPFLGLVCATGSGKAHSSESVNASVKESVLKSIANRVKAFMKAFCPTGIQQDFLVHTPTEFLRLSLMAGVL